MTEYQDGGYRLLEDIIKLKAIDGTQLSWCLLHSLNFKRRGLQLLIIVANNMPANALTPYMAKVSKDMI